MRDSLSRKLCLVELLACFILRLRIQGGYACCCYLFLRGTIYFIFSIVCVCLCLFVCDGEGGVGAGMYKMSQFCIPFNSPEALPKSTFCTCTHVLFTNAVWKSGM